MDRTLWLCALREHIRAIMVCAVLDKTHGCNFTCSTCLVKIDPLNSLWCWVLQLEWFYLRKTRRKKSMKLSLKPIGWSLNDTTPARSNSPRPGALSRFYLTLVSSWNTDRLAWLLSAIICLFTVQRSHLLHVCPFRVVPWWWLLLWMIRRVWVTCRRHRYVT